MGDGPPGFRRNFSCSAVLRILLGVFQISDTGLLPSLADFSKSFSYLKKHPTTESYNPKMQAFWFGLFPFRSPLLRESSFLFLPAGNEMFQFPASTSGKLCIDLSVTSYNRCWVSPFGNLWIKAYLQLPKAYRCSSRPSSAPSAKASTMRPCSLNLDLTVGFKKLLLAIEVFLSFKNTAIKRVKKLISRGVLGLF